MSQGPGPWGPESALPLEPELLVDPDEVLEDPDDPDEAEPEPDPELVLVLEPEPDPELVLVLDATPEDPVDDPELVPDDPPELPPEDPLDDVEPGLDEPDPQETITVVSAAAKGQCERIRNFFMG